jgi:phospholipid transport system substrate-binding protein
VEDEMTISAINRFVMRLGLTLLSVTLLVVSPALAGTNAEQFIKGKHDELTVILKAAKSGDQETRIAKVFDGMLDYQTLAQESLRDHWGSLNDAQRREFSDILRQLVQRAYRRNLDKTLGYQVAYQGQLAGDASTVVQTVASSKANSREEPVSVDYVVRSTQGAWLVVDIVTEGSSLVKGYRSQFNRIIKKEGFEGLVRRMKTKLGES